VDQQRYCRGRRIGQGVRAPHQGSIAEEEKGIPPTHALPVRLDSGPDGADDASIRATHASRAFQSVHMSQDESFVRSYGTHSTERSRAGAGRRIQKAECTVDRVRPKGPRSAESRMMSAVGGCRD